MYQYQMMYILFQGRGVVESRIPCSQTKKLKVFSDLVGVFANKRESEISSGLGKRARRKQLFLTSSKPFKTQQISDCQRWEPFLSISQMVFLSDSNRSARSISRMSSKQIWSCKMSVTWNLDQTILQKQNLTSTAQHSANHPTPGPWQWAANAWPLPGSSKQSKSCPSHFCKASGFYQVFFDSFQTNFSGSSANLWTPTLLYYRHGDLILLWFPNWISFSAPQKQAKVHRLHRFLCKIWPRSVLLLPVIKEIMNFPLSKAICHAQTRCLPKEKVLTILLLPGIYQVPFIVSFIWIHIVSRSPT